MVRLNMLKMLGLILLLAIALALPTVLPEAETANESSALVQKALG